MTTATPLPFLETRFHNINGQDLLQQIGRSCQEHDTLSIMSLNLDILIKLHRNPDFRQASSCFSLVLLDSTPLLHLIKRHGIPVAEKLSGSDLMPRVAAYAAQHGLSCFILGGAPGVPQAAARHLCAAYPGLRVAGTLSPEFGFTQVPALSQKVAKTIRASGADIVFVCLGAPKAELFIAKYLMKMGIGAVLSVGAAVDFTSGSRRRAPAWMQRAGLEWFFRFTQEPRRLFRRYFIESWQFLRIYKPWRH